MSSVDASRNVRGHGPRPEGGPSATAGWQLTFHDAPLTRRVIESLLTVADGRFGTRGAVEEDGYDESPGVMANGVYEHISDDGERPLPGPLWTRLAPAGATRESRWVLDLRRATVSRIRTSDLGAMQTTRFASLARPGWAALRAEGPEALVVAGSALAAPLSGATEVASGVDGEFMATASPDGGAIAAAAADEVSSTPAGRRVDRLAVYVADACRRPSAQVVCDELALARAVGFDRLLADHVAAWDRRWNAADIEIDGDEPELQAAVRFCLLHLIASVTDVGEAAVGARGLTGPNYGGHVFWDADVFVLPFLAATHPASARAMLRYRVARLGAARRAAAARGLLGARFPWESASTGDDVTPRFASTPDGRSERIYSGEHEEHIVADVAWACMHYLDWTGDSRFADGDGRVLLAETAAYWASRIRRDGDGVGHLDGVVGPDEYHDVVDDNAFTNAMARWNLRAAAAVGCGSPAGAPENDRWEALADSLWAGWDPRSARHEQFAGYDRLEPLLARDVGSPPFAADLILGRRRVRQSQLIKQPDVLMAHHLVPNEMAPGSLATDLDFYLPRTVHGSSLSPAICAGLLARAGRPDDALPLLRIAARIDLDDLTGTTAGGLHLAAMGGVWQALVTGFLGVRPHTEHLSIGPHLPAAWRRLTARVRYRGVPTRLSATGDTVRVDPLGPIAVRLAGSDTIEVVGPAGATFARTSSAWSRSTA